jgi:hypothetical protein
MRRGWNDKGRKGFFPSHSIWSKSVWNNFSEKVFAKIKSLSVSSTNPSVQNSKLENNALDNASLMRYLKNTSSCGMVINPTRELPIDAYLDASEVTSKKLCRCVWLVTSVDSSRKQKNVGDVLPRDFLLLGKFIFPEQSKTKGNDFVTRVANEKQRLHSSQRLSWSLRMGWQVVSTTIFEWLLNLRLKMWCLANLSFQSNQKRR